MSGLAELLLLQQLSGVDREAAEHIEFYCSGTCHCGHSRGMHDYPMGPCMEPDCKCKNFELAATDESRRAA